MTPSLDAITAAGIARAEIAPMTQPEAEEIGAWTYPGIYAFYNYSAEPDDLAELLEADRRAGLYFAVRLAEQGLVGFVQVWPVGEDGSVEIGLGLRPECTGRGLGVAFVRRLCEWLIDRVRLRPMTITLRVATFNARAITVYERAGFEPVETEQYTRRGATIQFLRMRRPVE
ncbi:MAG TPA: GNAT family N-acetyltransferase [Solirubrobacteraceae bacterium]|nr:GNAT family N-acetyltransferase [Solirubrobacteraceae bacterium]